MKHVPLGSPYSHSSSIDLGFVEIGLACIHKYVYTRTAAAAAPPVYVWCSILFSGQRSFVFLCCDTRMYRRFRGCPVVLDIELSVSACYHKTQRVLLRARRLLMVLHLESREQRAAACGVRHNVQTGIKWSGNKTTISCQSEHQNISPRPKHPRLKKHFFSSRNPM